MNKKKVDLPQVLVLKRSYIQRFPNGQQVALYHSDLLNQYITVPLDGSQFSNTTEAVLENLQQISSLDETKSIIFDDGSELNINKECADIILSYLSDNENLIEDISVSNENFLSLLETAIQIASDNADEKQELIEQ